jgi:hypothetical protein
VKGVPVLIAATTLVMLSRVLATQESPPPIARHQEASEAHTRYQEIASPMVIEVSLGATPKRKSLQDVQAWVATETGTYVCQQARVRAIEVRKEERRGKVTLRVLPSLVTQQRRQDMDVTISVVSDAKEIRTKSWESLTVGDDNSLANRSGTTIGAFMASTSKTPEADFEFTSQEFAALFGPERAPSVRVVLKIDE